MSDSNGRPSALNLYSGEPQHETFPRLDKLFPVGRLRPASRPHSFPPGDAIDIPNTFEFNDEERTTDAFLHGTDTAALLVLQNGAVRFEGYWLTGGPQTHWISWSVAKSFVSALVGIAIDEGRVDSVADPIDRYVRKLRGSAYEGTAMEDVLQMSSGMRWNEDYNDPDSDVRRFGAAISGGGSLDDYVASMQRAEAPGRLCQYNSADTQALGMLLIGATGRSITDYMQERLCEPLGLQDGGYCLLDSRGVEMAFGGLNLTARDFAKIGELFRCKGRWRERQVVPEPWVRDSVTVRAPHLATGRVLVGGHVLPLGYGYQWWIPEGDRGEFSAIGVYNQFVYVDPSRGVTIVKLSANRAYGTSPGEETNREMETIAFLRAVAARAN